MLLNTTVPPLAMADMIADSPIACDEYGNTEPTDKPSRSNRGYWQVNELDADELFYVLPETMCLFKSCVRSINLRDRLLLPKKKRQIRMLQPNRSNLTGGLSICDRLIRSQNIWCLPNVDRNEAEGLLRGAEVGNFILRVNHADSAMVLSRVAPDAIATDNNRDPVIRHNVIEVIPRSGYCLTADKQAHLIFDSLIQLLQFYLRLPESQNGNGGPFIRLPRAVMEARNVEQLDQLNQSGIEFWNVSDHKPQSCFTEPKDWDQIENTSRNCATKRTRTNSVDRWSRPHDAYRLENCRKANDYERRGRELRPVNITQLIGQDPGCRERASSLSHSPTDRMGNGSPARMNGTHCAAGLASRLNFPSVSRKWKTDQKVSPSPPPPPLSRKPNNHPGRTHTNRAKYSQNGVYEGDESELWKSLSPTVSASRQTSVVNSHLSKHTEQTPFLPILHKRNRDYSLTRNCDREDDVCPNPPSYCPTKTYMKTSFPRSEPHVVVVGRPVTSRNLDEHLRAIAQADSNKNQTDSLSHRLGGFKSHKHPDGQSDACGESLENSPIDSSQSQISYTRKTATNSESTENSQSGGDDKIVPASSIRNQDKSLTELPPPKTAGRVFVMEAATYSSADYDVFPDSAIIRPQPADTGRYACESLNTKNTFEKEPEQSKNGDCMKTEQHQNSMRRARAFCDKIDQSNSSSGIIRRHGVYWDIPTLQLDTTDLPSDQSVKTEDESSLREAISSDTKSSSSPHSAEVLHGSVTMANTKTIPTHSVAQCAYRSSPRASTEQFKPNQAVSFPLSQINMNGEDDDSPLPPSGTLDNHGVVQTTLSPKLTLLAAPRQIPSERDSLSARSSTHRGSTSVELDGADILPPSPACSSRASTVFCSPWDTVPMDSYLSDLITLGVDDDSVGNSGGRKSLVNKKPKKKKNDAETRRRTLASMEHRSLTQEALTESELLFDCESQSSDKQQLIGLWMQSANSPKHVAPDLWDTINNSIRPPPFLPPKPSFTRQTVVDSYEYANSKQYSHNKAEISPYAVTSCALSSTNTIHDRRDAPQDVLKHPYNQNTSLPTDFCTIYDDAFVETEEPEINDPSLPSLPHPKSNELLVHCKSEELLRRTPDGSIDKGTESNQKQQTDSYIYAQVIPHHLRQSTHTSLPLVNNEIEITNSNGTAEFPENSALDFQSNPSELIEIENRADASNIETSRCSFLPDSDAVMSMPSPGTLYPVTRFSVSVCAPQIKPHTVTCTTNRASAISSISGSCSLKSSRSSFLYYQEDSSHPMDSPQDQVLGTNRMARQSRRSGHYIRKFIKRLMKDPTNEVAEKIHLFLECTRDGSDRGWHYKLRSIRQFLSGITRHLVQNEDFGLSAAVESEKQQLTDFGFVNVGALLESSLEKYVLRLLYQYIVKQLTQEQIKYGELGPLRTVVQLAWSCPQFKTDTSHQISLADFGIPDNVQLPSDTTVQRVGVIFQVLEKTYCVAKKMVHLVEIFHLIQKEALGSSPDHHTNDPQVVDLYPVYAWTLARAGVLLHPVLPGSVDMHTPIINPAVTVFSPAALQADYIDGLLTDFHSNTQRADTGQRCLIDLFGTLYWAWDRHAQTNIHFNMNKLFFSLPRHRKLHGDLQSRENPVEPLAYPPDSGRCETSGTRPIVTDAMSHHTKRKLFHRGRSKTVIGVQLPPNFSSTPASPPHSPVLSSKFSLLKQCNTLRLSHSKQSILDRDVDPCAIAHFRWRPWVCSSVGTAAGSAEQLLLRLLVMDESSNQMRSLLHPIRMNLTAAELCKSLAHQMKLYNPKEFAMFLYADGKETRLPDEFHLADLAETHATNLPVDSAHSDKPKLTSTVSINPLDHYSNHPDDCNPDTCQNPSPSKCTSSLKFPLFRASSLTSRLLHRWRNNDEQASTRKTHRMYTTNYKQACDTNIRAASNTTRPVLIYRRISGFFALSDRALLDI